MTLIHSLRLAQVNKTIPGGHYVSKKEVARLHQEANPEFQFKTAETKLVSSASPRPHNPYMTNLGVFRYLDDVFNERYYASIKNRMPVSITVAMAQVEQYQRFDGHRLTPHKWMAGLGFIKALSSLGFIDNPKVTSALKRFKIEYANADRRDHTTRADQVKRLETHLRTNAPTVLDARNIAALIDDTMNPETQETAILMLFLGIVYSDAIAITDMNPTAVNTLLTSLGEYLKAQYFTNDVIRELDEDAELHLIHFVNVAAYRTLLEIKRKFESPHDPKAKLVYQMNEKQSLIIALSWLFEGDDQFTNLQKLTYQYGMLTGELQESIFAASALNEAGQQDLCQDLILSKIDAVLVDFFGDSMIYQMNNESPKNNFMSDLVGHPFFAILNSIDPDFAFTVFEEHIAKLRLFENSESALLPQNLRPDEDNFFLPLMEVFPDIKVLELCHNFLLSERTQIEWKFEVLDFYDQINNKHLIEPSLIAYLQTLTPDVVLEEDTINLYQAAVDIMLRIQKNSDHLRLVETPQTQAPNFFFDLAKIVTNQNIVAQIASNTLKNSKTFSLKKQALSYLAQTAKHPTQRTEIMHVALDVCFENARTDISSATFVLRLIEEIAKHPNSDSSALFTNLLARLAQNSAPETRENSGAIKAALQRALNDKSGVLRPIPISKS